MIYEYEMYIPFSFLLCGLELNLKIRFYPSEYQSSELTQFPGMC